MGDISRGGTIPADQAGSVTIPALVLCGGASPAWMTAMGRQVADVLPNGRHSVLEGREHVVTPEVLVPVLAEFFADRDDEPNCGGERVARPCGMVVDQAEMLSSRSMPCMEPLARQRGRAPPNRDGLR